MVPRLARTAAMALLAFGATATAADAQNYLHFQFKNCDADKVTVDVRVYNGADAATAVTITDAPGLRYAAEVNLYCIPGANIWDSGCKVHVQKGATVFQFRVQESSCFEGRYDYWFRPYWNCSC